jgi:rhamnogalacturonyl hydrolase YesR
MQTLVIAAHLIIGLSQSHTPIEATQIPGRAPDAPRVAVIGGWNGVASTAVANFRAPGVALTLIPLVNPDASPLVFPPAGVAYRQNPESHYLWRWLDLHGIDLVVCVGDGGASLATALQRIPAITLSESDLKLPTSIPRSEANKEIDRRIARTAREVAEELAKFYGHDFSQPVYINALALIGRLRLGQVADVQRLAEPYVDGSKDSLAKANATFYAGHLLFAELAARTHDPRYVARVQAAAELASTPSGDEMSDGVFMACPILAAAGHIDRALRHLRYMERLDLRPDGLYRHSPLNDAAWGRGNAFPALGMAWTLEQKEDPEILRSYQSLIAALAKYQDPEGMWHQVIDQPGSYAEFSSTAMIADAMLKGIRHKWLDAARESRVQRAWKALLARIGPEGQLIDVCESTGKQKSADDYLNRAASNGKDARGGAMALLLATDLGKQ